MASKRKEKNKFDEKFSKNISNENYLKMGKKSPNKIIFNEHVSEMSNKQYKSVEELVSKRMGKYSNQGSSKKENLNRYIEDGKLNFKHLRKKEYTGKIRPSKGKITNEGIKSTSPESSEPKNQMRNISEEIKNHTGSSDAANVWMVHTHTCGPDICSLEQDDLSRMTDVKHLEELEEYNTNSLPFPVKNKYLEILKVHDFPFDEIGPFQKSKVKEKKCKVKPPVTLVQNAMNEANALFTKAGYEDELIKWLARIFKIYPRPEDPHEYLKYNSGGEDIKSNSEFLQHLEELKHLLAFENELAFELAQIKLLCGMIDEETFGFDGKPRDEWNNQIKIMRKKKILSKLNCLSILYSNVNKEIKEEKKHIAEEKAEVKQAMRAQIMKDLPIWKEYLSPIPVTTEYMENDGRITDWFKCLRFPDTEGKTQAPVYEFDDIDAFKEETFEELKSRSSSLLEEDFK